MVQYNNVVCSYIFLIHRQTFTSSGGRLLQSSKPIPGIYGYFINNKSGCVISSLNLVLPFYIFGFFYFSTAKIRLNFLTWWTPHEVQVFQEIEYGSIKMANILIRMRGYSFSTFTKIEIYNRNNNQDRILVYHILWNI